jgi:hypothetical protein
MHRAQRQEGHFIPPTDEETRTAITQRVIQELTHDIGRRVAQAVIEPRDPRPLILKRLERQIYMHYLNQQKLDDVTSVILDKVGTGAAITVELVDDTFDRWEWACIDETAPMRGRRWTIVQSGRLDADPVPMRA